MNAISSPLPVAVAVSGGADSLHTLIRLRESGTPVFALHGIFFQPDMPDDLITGHAGHQNDDTSAKSPEAVRQRLVKACEDLGVPLHIVDFTAEFLQSVIRPFVQSYADGLTPNPCALCNARVKFGLLLDKAKELGAGRLATGHYARLLHEEGGEYGPVLLQGADPYKDQSYFLSLVPRERLAAALFPLGEAHKSDVLATLAGRNIVPPQPGESQEVCFVPNDEYREFLPRAAKTLGITLPGPGPMILADGQRLATHKGLWHYTEGQRRGLGLGWKEPLHVIAKRAKDNALLLGPRRDMRADGCACNEVNILLPPRFWPDTVLVKTRYREQPKAARAAVREQDGPDDLSLRIDFLEPDAAVAPGQIAAVYIPFERNAPDRKTFETNAFSTSPHEKAPLRLVAGGVISEVY